MTASCEDPSCPSYGQMGGTCTCGPTCDTAVSGSITLPSAADFLRQIGARFDNEEAHGKALAAVALMLTRRVM